MMQEKLFLFISIYVALSLLSCSKIEPYQNESLSFEERVDDLVGRMTSDQKISQLQHNSPAIPQLGIPEYNWRNEGLHGVARSGLATVFQQTIGMAAMWDEQEMFSIANVISDEARAKYHHYIKENKPHMYQGLNYWSPNINIFRDPRWGRGMETYGEDPYLTGELGVQFIKGLQGDGPKYYKLVATAKHFAVHSGPEFKRHRINVRPTHYDLLETYTPPFEKAVKDARVYSVMCAYNRLNDKPCCGNPYLNDLLRQEWNFEGYIVSDCGALRDFYNQKAHEVVNTRAEAAAMALRAGTDLNCGNTYQGLIEALQKDYISEYEIDQSLKRLLLARMKLGMFDAEKNVPYAQIPITVVDSKAHREAALRAAQKSMVLLKNANQTLPLSKNLKSIAVIGPNANNEDVLLGNSMGYPSHVETPLNALRKKLPHTKITYAQGCSYTDDFPSLTPGIDLEKKALQKAKSADVIIMCMGLNPRLEGEDIGMDIDGFYKGDRTTISLPATQQRLIKSITKLGKPTILVLMNGSALAINWSAKNVDAILEAWYPGQAGGTAIADILFGDYNPAGRLPVTFYKSIDQLPHFEDYSMENRTYRYFKGEPLFAFGHGLSYSRFEYDNLILSDTTQAGENLQLKVSVHNSSNLDGDEVVQVYVSHPNSDYKVPIRSLKRFKRVHIKAGETKKLTFQLEPKDLAVLNKDYLYVLENKPVEICVGGKQADSKSTHNKQVIRGKTHVTNEQNGMYLLQ